MGRKRMIQLVSASGHILEARWTYVSAFLRTPTILPRILNGLKAAKAEDVMTTTAI
jgi:hypothetical protein